MSRPSVLIEKWLPIAEVGVESMRERGASSALPPLYFLHVWWARRPLIASRAAILASVLPQWSEDWPVELLKRFPNEKMYHEWFKFLLGIRGDPVKGYKLLQWARREGKKIPNPYQAGRAFQINPIDEDLEIMQELIQFTWGKNQISMLDPFAGGGSIPFEALRYGFNTYANDLNPVAATILKATLDFPARFGPDLAEDIRKWGERWYELVKPKLEPYFTPLPAHAEGAAYLWARTIQWNGRTIPLSPNWWLAKGAKPAAVRVITDPNSSEPRFEILTGKQIGKYDPDMGTVSRGEARCPWSGETIDGDYIKAEAQAGRMGQVLYAVATKVSGGFEFRAPTNEDVETVKRAENQLREISINWKIKDVLPSELIPQGNKTSEPLRYGFSTWSSLFLPRQLLSLGIMSDSLRDLYKEIIIETSIEKADALLVYLSFAIDKAADRNSYQTRWVSQRQVIANTFDRHDFAMKWSFAEFDSSENLLPWCLSQIIDSYSGISNLLKIQKSFFVSNENVLNIKIFNNSANNLSRIPSNSIHNVTIDPPYYDNVQYSELSDFFYVWLKRNIDSKLKNLFDDELTNKDDEAVSNPARFISLGKKKKELAEQDYQNKMTAAFREINRILHPQGVLTVMFTHKKVEAWDSLATALIEAGFTIKASWPIHTEFQHSLHQARQNAAASTIFLVCRKRENIISNQVWWEDLQSQVRAVAREKAAEYVELGITGADLYISTFGPTLSVISQNWPVLTSEVDPKTGQPKVLRPEVALDLAREEVVRLRKQGLLAGREVQFDTVTDWYLIAWDAYAAEQFPFDEANKLAIALGIDLSRELMQSKRLAVKKSEYIILQTPQQRRRRGMVDDDLTTFTHWIDAAHTAMMVYAEDGAGACDVFLQKSGLKHDTTFKALLQSMINAIPRNRIKGKFVRPEAEILENMRLAFYAEDLTVPVEEEPLVPQETQLELWEEEEDEIEEEE